MQLRGGREWRPCGGTGGPPPPPPPCFHFYRGACHYGDACRFSHAPPEELPGVLPFHHRQFVAAPGGDDDIAAAAGDPAPPGAWRLRIMSYNVLADHLAHEHAAELYNSGE